MTIAVTFTGGIFLGVVCGALTNLINHALWGWGWEGYLFIICNIATAFITWLFMKLFPRELNLTAAPSYTSGVSHKAAYKSSRLGNVMDRVIVLIILSYALCLAMSFLGGLIAALILNISTSYNFGGSGITAFFSATMFKDGTPVLIAEIVSRIPVNIVDRLISAFAGYGIALCIRRALVFFPVLTNP